MIEDLHRRHHAELVKVLRRRFREHHDAVEDAVQSAFVRFSELEDRSAVGNPRAFLLVMARNLLLNQIARAGVVQRNVEQEIQAPSVPVVEEMTPETVLLEREKFRVLNQAILSLPEEQRGLLVMSRIEGMTYGEISTLTGRSPADISRQIARALSALQSRMAVSARPRWTFNVGAQYRIELPQGWDVTVRGDYYRQSESWMRVYNTEYDRLRAWDNANLSMTVTNPDGTLAVQAYIKNVFDKTPITDGFTGPDELGNFTNVFTLDPRIMGVSVRSSF